MAGSAATETRAPAASAAAAAVAGVGARLGAKGSHWLLIGRRPDQEQLAKWVKPTADGDPDTGGPPGGGSGGPGGAGPRRPGGPPDRYRDEDGQVIDRRSGQVLHDQNSDRTLLSTRAHNRLVRLRGYRILHRGGRTAYGATLGLPATVRRARAGGSRYSQDVRQQVRVWGNTVREDAHAWADMGRQAARSGPFRSRRLPAAPTAVPSRRPNPVQPTTARTGSPAGRPGPAPARPAAPTSAAAAAGNATPAGTPASPNRLAGGSTTHPASPSLNRTAPAHPGEGNARSTPRDEARARMRDLLRHNGPEAEPQRQADRLREMRAQWQAEDGEDG
ncbi:hypothetical protein QFZ66_000145 [Streptomyces sp. B4I13]|uniref:hypothetical protein n=1 Tax=Streptomyces sp. B4I13 TaxID=3042271 RepID=UPI00278B6326|nr:hypothetical protein [Streptomyces sp. B4I13]MDQ0956267.1 hypothetical protein [Streptomyces sp. B4I13]